MTPPSTRSSAQRVEHHAVRQPLVHDLVVCLHVPWQAWSCADGQVRADGAQGVYCGDTRVLSRAELTVGGQLPEPVATVPHAAHEVTFVAIVRTLGDPVPDPTVRVDRHRWVGADRVEEAVTVTSTARLPVRAAVALDLAADLAPIGMVKSGGRPDPLPPVEREGTLCWETAELTVVVEAAGAVVNGAGRLAWTVDLPERGSITLTWSVAVRRRRAFITAPATAVEWVTPHVTADDRRLAPVVERSLDDLAALRATLADRPADTFVAAGAPWYLTLFGRDSLWTARVLLPLGTGLAASTLRVLAAHQGRRVDHRTAEAPGKIPHELRPDGLHLALNRAGGGAGDLVLPPVYYGTVDATPLWVCLLNDAWRWGLASAEVERLLPAAEAALHWMAEYGDSDRDGFLDYVDHTGSALANQGWKDSGDAIQWRDGALAVPPVALCEVQGYAHEAALAGAALLDAFGRPDADRWRGWAAALADRFRERFWITDAEGPYPAVALDGDKRPVDTLTSNIGHLLGTGLLTADEEAIVAGRVSAPGLFSGFGVRTMATGSAGFSPLSYHGGSVWPHDTAIVLHGLARGGHVTAAAPLVDGLLTATTAFGDRLPELFSGDARAALPRPVPYPAACRPQAWSAASSVALLAAVLGVRPDLPGGTLDVRPLTPSPLGAVAVRSLRLGGHDLAIDVDAAGAVRHVETTAPVVVR